MLITKENQAEILMKLYNNAKPQGMGFLHYDPKPMTLDEAKLILSKRGDYFDYLQGRVMKLSLKEGKQLDTRLYNRDNGEGSAERALGI